MLQYDWRSGVLHLHLHGPSVHPLKQLAGMANPYMFPTVVISWSLFFAMISRPSSSLMSSSLAEKDCLHNSPFSAKRSQIAISEELLTVTGDHVLRPEFCGQDSVVSVVVICHLPSLLTWCDQGDLTQTTEEAQMSRILHCSYDTLFSYGRANHIFQKLCWSNCNPSIHILFT